MKIKPMSPEEAIESLIDYCEEDEAIHRNLINTRSGREWGDKTQESEYLRNTLASVLLWARDEMEKEKSLLNTDFSTPFADTDRIKIMLIGHNEGIDVAQLALTRLAEEIIKE